MIVMETLSNAIDGFCRKILLVMISMVTVIVIVAVIARYVFNTSFPWSEEVARALLTWIVFLGATSAYHHREMVAMESLRDALSDKAALAIRLISEVILIIVMAAVVYASYRLISLTSRQTFPVLGYPLWYAYVSMPVFAVIISLHSITRFIKLLNGSEPIRREFNLEELV